MNWSTQLGIVVLLIATGYRQAGATQCYQCSSEMDVSCPAYRMFDREKNALVECYGLESFVPGTFCMKITKESKDSLFGKGWKTIHRRCGSRTYTGLSWGCLDYTDEYGIYTEVCICNHDGCNSAQSIPFNRLLFVLLPLMGYLLTLWKN